MPIPNPPLSSLDPAAVAEVQEAMASRIRDAMPDVDTRRGAIHDRVIHLAAILAADAARRVELVRRSQSLVDIAADPDLVDDGLVDAVLANHRVARVPGTRARGRISVVVSSMAPTTLAAGTTFRFGGLAVATTATVSARIDGAASAVDQPLAPLGDGRYAFSVPAEAVEPGLAGRLRRGDRGEPDQPPPFFVEARIADDWVGGGDPETTASLIARLIDGIAAPTWSNRATIAAMIRARPEFADVATISIIGAGDPEMRRNRRGLFPVAVAGPCDLYVRGDGPPVRAALRKTAVLEAVTADGAVWRTTIGRDDAPGFHEVVQILPEGGDPGSPGFAVVDDVRGLDLDGEPSPPDLADAAEGAYSRWQTAVVRFLDPDPPAGATPGQTTRTCSVTVAGEPRVAELQAFLSDRRNAPPGGDVVVKSAVPLETQVVVNLLAARGAGAVDQSALTAAVLGLVNGLGFAGRLLASEVIAAAAATLPPGVKVGSVDLFGRIRGIGGEIRYLSGRDALVVPAEPAIGVSPRTAAFSLDPGNVVVTLTPSDPAEA